MNEIRRTADSGKSESEAKPARSKKHGRRAGAHGVVGDGMSGSARFNNQGDLWRRECHRSQSPHSSWEAANPRGAKGGRKVEA